jgi:hypothetical protein
MIPDQTAAHHQTANPRRDGKKTKGANRMQMELAMKHSWSILQYVYDHVSLRPTTAKDILFDRNDRLHGYNDRLNGYRRGLEH